MINQLLQLSFWLTVISTVSATTVPIYIQPFGTQSVYQKGYLNIDPAYATYSPFEDAEFYSGPACLGIKNDQDEFQCMTFGDILPAALEEYVVHMNNDKIEHIDYSRTPRPSGVSDSLVKVITGQAKGPAIPYKEPVTLVNNQVPVEVPEKSFLQKYWMVLLPIAIMMLTGGGPAAE